MRLSWHKRRHDAALHSMDGVTQVVDVFAVVGGQEDGHAGGGFFVALRAAMVYNK